MAREIWNDPVAGRLLEAKRDSRELILSYGAILELRHSLQYTLEPS